MQAQWRRGFGHADERPYRRLTGDAIRLVLAAIVVVLTSVRAGRPSGSQLAFDTFLTSLPGALDGLFRTALALGSLWGVGLVLGAALLARRFRLAAVLAGAGVLAWLLARTAAFVDSGHGLFGALGAAVTGGNTGPYPSVHVAVLAAIVLSATPFLSRPSRRVGQVLLWVLVPGAVVLGAADTNAVVGGLAIGWGVAAAAHLAFGSPAGRPTLPTSKQPSPSSARRYASS